MPAGHPRLIPQQNRGEIVVDRNGLLQIRLFFGQPVSDRSSVTVVSRDGATSDSLDTAAYVLGPERGLALVESVEGAAAYIVRETSDGPQTFESRRFKEIPRAPAKQSNDSAEKPGKPAAPPRSRTEAPLTSPE